MQVRSFLIAGILACTFLSCVFQPDENFVVIDQTPKAELTNAELRTVDLMTQPDTFEIVTRETVLNISMQIESASLKAVYLWIDGKAFYGISSDLNFQIKAADYPDGYHKIEVKMVTTTGTGSLADQEGREEKEWTREWTFHVERVTPPLVSITAIEPLNGMLVIDFEPNAAETHRLLELEYRNGSYVVNWSYLITDPAQTRIIDDRFIEGSLKATMTNLSIDAGFPSAVHVMEKQFDVIPGIVESKTDGHGNVITKFNRSLFYNNVKFYRLTVDGVNVKTTGGSDTTVTTNHLGFSGSYGASLRTYAARLVKGQDTVRLLKPVTTQILVGEIIDHQMEAVCWSRVHPQFGFAIDDIRDELQVLDGVMVVSRYPVDTLQSIMPATMATSNDGQHVFLAIHGRILKVGRDGSSSIILNTRTVSIGLQIIDEISLGDRYLAFVSRTGFNRADQYVHVYDLQEEVLVGDPIPVTHSIESLRLSPDDKFLAVLQSSAFTIYTLDNESFVLTKTLSSFDARDIYFHTAGDGRLILIRTSGFTMYDPATDESVVRNYSGELVEGFAASTVSYDPVRGYFGSVTTDKHYIVDTESGEILRRIPASGNGFFIIYDGNMYRRVVKYDCKL